MVVTLIKNSLIVDHIFRNYINAIEGYDLLVDLILRKFQDFDAILDRDWLST